MSFFLYNFDKYYKTTQQKSNTQMTALSRKEFIDDREDVFSKSVRAGKRTYFFDVKTTRNNDFYLTITESKKKVEDDGLSNFEKHKIFLYKEDFKKFSESLEEVIRFIRALMGDDFTDEFKHKSKIESSYKELSH